jgi:hypothetical protein
MANIATGKGSTFQIITQPGFWDSYELVNSWEWHKGDYHYVFLRRAYPNYPQAHALLESVDPLEFNRN